MIPEDTYWPDPPLEDEDDLNLREKITGPICRAQPPSGRYQCNRSKGHSGQHESYDYLHNKMNVVWWK